MLHEYTIDCFDFLTMGFVFFSSSSLVAFPSVEVEFRVDKDARTGKPVAIQIRQNPSAQRPAVEVHVDTRSSTHTCA